MKKLIAAGFLLLGLTLFSCQDLNPIDPAKEFKSIDNFGTFVDTTFYADSAFFVVNPYVLTHASEKISVGNYKGFKASFLMNFTRMPSDSAATYDSIFVILSRRHVFGKDQEQLNVTVSVPDQEWSDSANTLPQWHNYQPAQTFHSFTVNADDTDEVIIPIPESVFNNWVQDGEANKGLFISPGDDQSSFILEFDNFYITDPAKWPKLVYRSILPDTIEHDTTNIGLTATIFDYDVDNPQSVYNLAQDSGDLILSSGIGCRVLVHFSALGSIPESSIIYSSDLIFQLKDVDFSDPALPNVLSNDDHPGSYYLRMVKSASTKMKLYEVDSIFSKNSYYSYNLTEDGEEIHFNNEDDQIRFGKSFVQSFLNGQFSNTWFLLQFQDERADVSVKRIQSVLKHGIQLKLRYYTVKSEGF